MPPKKKAATKHGKRPTDAETLGKLLDQYGQVFGEVGHFIELIARQESEIGVAKAAVYEAKEKYDRLRDELKAILAEALTR